MMAFVRNGRENAFDGALDRLFEKSPNRPGQRADAQNRERNGCGGYVIKAEQNYVAELLMQQIKRVGQTAQAQNQARGHRQLANRASRA